MYFYILFIIGLLCLFLLIKSKVGVVTVNDEIDNLYNEDEFIHIPDERAYFDETNAAIVDLKKRVDEFGISEEDVVEIKKLKKEISLGFEKWGSIIAKLDQLIDERIAFVNESSFYPRSFITYDLTDMKMKRENSREFQLDNPLKPTDEFDSYIKEEQDKVVAFVEFKSKVLELLPILDIYEASLKIKKAKIAYFSLKQEMFIAIQDGDIKKAKKAFGRLRAKTKQLQQME